MVKRMMFAAALAVTCVAAVVVGAAPQAPVDGNAPRTLTEYLTYAALQNAGLKAAFEEWTAALEQIPQAKALPDPKFTYEHFIEQLDTRQRVGLMQMFPWFGKIAARTDAATAAANAAQKRYEARRLRLFSEVKEAFHEYAYLDSANRIARENLDLMRHFEEVARTKYITATAMHPDIIRAQIEVARLQNDLVSFEQQRRPVVARLNAALNRSPGAELPWPRREPDRPVELDRGKLIALLDDLNPELQALGYEVERLRREVDVAKRNFYPDIGLGVSWMEMNMGPGVREHDAMIGVELNLPIWRRSYRAGELQARAMARRAGYERKDLENRLAARLERALYEFEDRGRELRLYNDVLIPRSRELVGASEAAYMAGAIDFLSLIDAQQTLLRFQLARERSWADQQQRLAELEMLVGADL